MRKQILPSAETFKTPPVTNAIAAKAIARDVMSSPIAVAVSCACIIFCALIASIQSDGEREASEETFLKFVDAPVSVKIVRAEALWLMGKERR